jgi:hypothetical protein
MTREHFIKKWLTIYTEENKNLMRDDLDRVINQAAVQHTNKQQPSNKIKLRAWDESQQYMAYQGSPDLETIQSFIYHFGDKPLMLSTLVFDVNNVEIFENDIVEIEEITGVVKFISGSFVNSADNNFPINLYNKNSIKVVGNIYEVL